MIRVDGITIDRKHRVIWHGKAACGIKPVYFRLACALLLAGPRQTCELFDLVYRDRDDGGPMGGPYVIDAMMTQLKPKLRKVGIEIRGARRGCEPRKRYWAAPQ